jgi:hypothetical protein
MGIILILKVILLFLLKEKRIYLYRNCIFGITIENILGN